MQHTFCSLIVGQLFLRWVGQGWYDSLRIGSEQILAQCFEIAIKSFDLPFHWVRFDCNHLGLALQVSSDLRCNELINAGHYTLGATVSRKFSFLNNFSLLSSDGRLSSGPVQRDVEHLGSARIKHYTGAARVLT